MWPRSSIPHVAVGGEQVLAVEACLADFLQRADGLG
jgi:hypothetical protein